MCQRREDQKYKKGFIKENYKQYKSQSGEREEDLLNLKSLFSWDGVRKITALYIPNELSTQ
jgi:hypothetical protein